MSKNALVGWEFTGTDDTSWHGQRTYPDGKIREVAGKTEAEVHANATEVDRHVTSRIAGTQEQNEAIADRLHEQADAVASGT